MNSTPILFNRFCTEHKTSYYYPSIQKWASIYGLSEATAEQLKKIQKYLKTARSAKRVGLPVECTSRGWQIVRNNSKPTFAVSIGKQL
jgi:hypothetical protein